MKSITITYCFLLLIVGLFLYTGNSASAKNVESKKVKTEITLIDSKPVLTINTEEKTHNLASTQLESLSNLSFTDFKALIPPNELRNQFRINIRFRTLKI